MNASRIAALAALSFAAVAAQAETPDPSGQFATQVNSATTRAAVQADKYRGQSPYAGQYNPVANFRGQKTRAQVTGEYLAARGQVEAFTGEDSGAAWLSAHRGLPVNARYAGQPATVR